MNEHHLKFLSQSFDQSNDQRDETFYLLIALMKF
jgi:hypothetical protein